MQIDDINRHICNKNYSKLGRVFTSSKLKFNYNKATSPFNEIFTLHALYGKQKTYTNGLNVLKALRLVNEDDNSEFILYRYVITNMLGVISGSDENTRHFTQVLMDLYREGVCKYYVVNILFSLYFTIRGFELCYNFMLVTEGDKLHKKQFHVYNLYKSILHLYKHDIEQATECISTAYRSKKIKKQAFFLFYFISLINNKIINKQHVREYGSDMHIKLQNTVAYGIVTDVYNDIHKFKLMLVQYNLYSTVCVYVPLVCFSNLVRRLYHIKSNDHKMDIQHIVDCCDMKYENVINLLCSVIDYNLIKAYISINKNVIVFSKKEPFPMRFY